MKMTDRISNTCRQLGASLSTLAAVALRSRPVPAKPRTAPLRPLLILGNGPSLNDTLATQREAMRSYDLLAVNFAANAPVFGELQPQHYVLADPHFFASADDANVSLLWKNLEATDWPLTLHLPQKEAHSEQAKKWQRNAPQRLIRPFNMVAADGFPSLRRQLISTGLAMPRPRNVLIPSIMAGIRMGYKKIVIAGADHTWTRTLSVDENNTVISIQPHFYNDNAEEHQRVASVYKDVRMHQILESMVVAFRSYHHIQDYASRHGIEILNATPGSFIDAFPRIGSL